MTNDKLEKMLSEMSHVWKTESSFMSWLRGGIRRIWAKHPVKLDFIKQNRVKIPNPNPNGRVKTVWGGKCALTGEYFVLNELECDHKVGNSSLKSVEDIQSFVEGVLLVTADDLQLVSKEAHKIKSYAEKQGISFEEAKIEKEVIEIIKQKKEKEYLQEHQLPVSSTKSARRATIVAHKLSLLNKGENSD